MANLTLSYYDPAARLSQLMSDAAIALLLNEGAQLGAAVLFLVPERGKAPSGCEAVIEVERTAPHGTPYQTLHYRFAEVGVNSARYVGEADAMHPDAMHELATALAQLEAPVTFGADLASAVSFLNLLGYTTVAELVQETQHKWQQSCAPEHANWLQAKVGLMAGNKPRTLVFSAKRDGVHGMVAGSTGSGKSELLITFIMSMAVTYDPSVLNFVLVDYKGGGAFKELAALPHCVDVITNLGEEGVTRMFTAINAELKRRQALNANTGTKNIVDYRHRGLHQRHQPYPFLFIIIDEFAEMIDARPDFKNQLETITRLGRAQGVSLLLAAQRPSGVTEQMRANIKFRLCLRVETAGESREMLRRAEAAYLPNGFAGRGYLQVGNEEIELIQIAYAGDPYREPQSAPPPAVLWPKRHPGYDPERDQAPQPLYIELAQRLSKLAQAVAVPRQLAPWPDFLPTTFALDSLLITQDPALPALTSSAYLTRLEQITFGQPTEEGLSLNPAVNKWLNGSCGWIAAPHWRRYALRPVIGLIDDPANARQLPLVLDLPRGHVVIFGASGWGKTTLIRTLVISLTASHSPAYLHLYLLDLGGRNLNGLAALPHVGAIITPDEEAYRERVEQLMRELENHIERRKQLFQEAACQDLYQYNDSRLLYDAPRLLPAIVVVIDNFLAFQETFGKDDGHGQAGEIFTKFVALARQGRAYGVHFVITATRLNSVPDALYNLFTERLTFKLTDTTDYRAIVGGLVNDIGEIPGRGYCKVGRAPLSFQVALPFEARRPVSGVAANETQEVGRLAQYMQHYLAQSGQGVDLPLPIEALPHTILLEEILARQHGLTRTSTMREQLQTIMRTQWTKQQDPNLADWLRAAIGVISGNRLRELCMEATVDGVHGMVAGGTGSGKSELLMTLIVTLAIHYAPATLNFVLIDYKGGGAFAHLAGLPHCVDLVTNLSGAAVKRIFTAIKAEMERRQKLNTATDTKDIVAYRKAGLHLTHAPYPYLFIIIDEYAEMIAANPEFKSELESITRLGRAQGVHLLLAAQKPMGVTDQMRENIKFRICLKVESIDTSRELMRRGDAAFIPDRLPGRGYLQIGNGPLELMQCAFAGASCAYLPTAPGAVAPKFFAVVVELAQTLAATKPRAPWPPPLPAQLSLTAAIHKADVTSADQERFTLSQPAPLRVNPFLTKWLIGDGGWPAIVWPQQALHAVVGLVDNPQRARLLPLTVDFSQGHAVILGAPGSGKTTFLRTLVTTLATTHAPNEFHAHLLDLGGRNLESLQRLPHVGTVITKEEAGYEERVQQLLREVEAIIDQRKQLFSQSKVATLLEYNGGRPQPLLAALIVAIDNFAEFSETFTAIARAGGVEDPLAAFVQLVRQAGAYGVYFVITANRLSEVPNKLYTLFTQRFALRLSDPGDYSAIVGAHAPAAEEIPGRGCTQLEQRILTFQVACLAAQDAAGKQLSEYGTIDLLGQQMDHTITQTGYVYQPPLSITALPRGVSCRHLWSELLAIPQDKAFMNGLQQAMVQRWAENGSAVGADWLKVPIGVIAGNRKRILAFEAKKDGVHGLVAGGTGSGKSELLMTLIVGLAINYSPEILNFVLVDYKGGGAFKPFTRLPHCVDLVTNTTTLN